MADVNDGAMVVALSNSRCGMSWMSYLVWVAISLVLVVVWVVESMPSAVIMFFGEWNVHCQMAPFGGWHTGVQGCRWSVQPFCWS
jgi:hypothetical protein